MTTSLTIIIPLLEDTDTDLFEATLVSILENRPEEDDILVVNAAGYENSYDLTRDEGVIFVTADPSIGLIDAINLGVLNSNTPYVCPLLCGCEVAEDWARPALELLADEKTAVVIPKTSKVTTAGRRLASFGYALRRDGVLLPLRSGKLPAASLAAPDMAGVFFRRRTVLDLGLFQPALGPMAYADMALLCGELGLDVLFAPDSVLTYSAALFPSLSRTNRLTAQEALFRRWAGVWKSRAQSHSWRLFKEKLFGGADVRRAYALAKERIEAPRPEQLLADALVRRTETREEDDAPRGGSFETRGDLVEMAAR